MRYQFTKTQKNYLGKSVYETTYYPTIHPSPSDIYIISNDTDFLDSLAYKYYGNESYWWIIAKANNLGFGRLSVPEGLQLRIPTNINAIIEQIKNYN